MLEDTASVRCELTPAKTLTPAARRFLFEQLGEKWVTDHPFAVGEKVTLEEARYLLPWLKEQQEEERATPG